MSGVLNIVAVDRFTTQVTTQVDDKTSRLLQACKESATLADLMRQMGLRSRKHFRTAIVGPAVKNGFTELTAPDKPRSRFQRYRITEKGKEIVASRIHKSP